MSRILLLEDDTMIASGILYALETDCLLYTSTAVNVQVGDIVKEGDPLVTLDQKDIEKQIAELKTNINLSLIHISEHK